MAAPARSVVESPPLELVEVRDHRPSPLELIRGTWRLRSLLLPLGLRQIVKGYVGTKLGRTWLLLRPLVSIFGMALLFGSVLRAPSNGVPYLLFLLVAMLPWMCFERTVFWATRSFDIYRKVAGRMQIPTLLVPTAAAAPMAVEIVILAALTACTAAFYWIGEGFLALQVTRPETLLALAGLMLALALAWGLGLWLSALNALARDVRVLLKFVLPVWLYVTPVIYPISALPERWRFLATINPVTAPVELVKEGLLNAGALTGAQLAVSLGTCCVLCVTGLWFIARLSPRLLRSTPLVEDDEEEEIL